MTSHPPASGSRFVIGLDLGTSSAKGVLLDLAGRVVLTASRRYVTAHPAPGMAEHDPESTWWVPAVELLRELTAGVQDRVAGVCVSGLGPCVAVTDAAGTALRPAILYGVDTRSVRQIEEMRSKLSASDRAASRLSTQSVGPKLRWIEENEPGVWDRARRVFTSHTYVSFRLTGAYTIDVPSASWWDPLVEADPVCWNAERLSDWFGGLEFPRIVEATSVVGVISELPAQQTGLRPGTPVYSGAIDYAAEVLGVGAVHPGQCVTIFGSTLSVNLVTAERVSIPGLQNSPGALPGSHYVGGVTATAGSLLDWMAGILGDPPRDALIEKASVVAPGSEGLVLLPYLSGERSPIDDPHARGLIAGLDLAHRPEHLFRAAHEAIGYSLRHLLDTMGPMRPSALIAAGGGTANPLLMRVVADIAGVDLAVVDQRHCAAVGSAQLALFSFGGAPECRTPARSVTVRPRPEAGPIYDELYSIYRELAQTSTGVMHRLSTKQPHGFTSPHH